MKDQGEHGRDMEEIREDILAIVAKLDRVIGDRGENKEPART